MRNLILKHNDHVRYHIETPELTALGYKLGEVYLIQKGPLGSLSVVNGSVAVLLVHENQDLGGWAEHFAKIVLDCPILSRGVS